MEEYNKYFKEVLECEEFRKLTASGRIDGDYKKIVVEKIRVKDNMIFQLSCYTKDKVQHLNVDNIEPVYLKLILFKFKQLDFLLTNKTVKFLISKKLEIKKYETVKEIKDNEVRTHNKKKNYIIEIGKPVEWLIALDIMDKNGQVYASKQKKFRQINKYLELIDNVYHLLPDKPVIMDFGCGKSYLTFALYYFLTQKGLHPTIIGLDLKKDVVDYCQSLAIKFGFDNLSFINQDVKTFKSEKQINMVISLHACDIATDYAIYAAIKFGSEICMSVPCCHKEIKQQIDMNQDNYILKHGILKDKFGAIITDALRGLILEEHGYKVNIHEFIEIEDTPKNVVIQALKSNKQVNKQSIRDEIDAILAKYNVTQTLNELVKKL